MKVYAGFQDFKRINNAVVTTGTFDGVHIGHKKIISRLIELAKKTNGESVLITFNPHPRLVLQPENNNLKLISTLEEKIEQLEHAGIDHLIIQPFTIEFSRTTSLNFIRDLLVNSVGTKTLVIGYDHHFGRNREGSFEHLQEFGPLYGFNVEEIPALDINEVNVSSTKIRNALLEGDISSANQYLGYTFAISGKVVEGNSIGRTIDFPTANIHLDDPYKIIPKTGVYICFLRIDNAIYHAMVNIGLNPTVSNSQDCKIEAHILNFTGDLYNKTVQIQFMTRIRDEIKFESLTQLKQQLEHDKITTQSYFS